MSEDVLLERKYSFDSQSSVTSSEGGIMKKKSSAVKFGIKKRTLKGNPIFAGLAASPNKASLTSKTATNSSYMSYTEASDSDTSGFDKRLEFDPLEVEPKYYFHPYADK